MINKIEDLKEELKKLDKLRKRTEAYDKLINSSFGGDMILAFYEDVKLRKDNICKIDPTSSLAIAGYQHVISYLESLIKCINSSSDDLVSLRMEMAEKSKHLGALKREQEHKQKREDESERLFPSEIREQK